MAFLVGHVLQMFLGWGHVIKIPGTELDGWPYFLQKWLSHMSAMCPQSQSRVFSSIWDKKLANQPNLPNSCSEDKFDSSVWLILHNFSYGITKQISIPKWKMRCQKKFCFTNKKCITKHISSPSPLVPLLILAKIHVFASKFFLQKLFCKIN